MRLLVISYRVPSTMLGGHSSVTSSVRSTNDGSCRDIWEKLQKGDSFLGFHGVTMRAAKMANKPTAWKKSHR